MAGLFQTLNVGAESLYASRQGVDTTGHNIANAQVEGFSRQRVNIQARDPLQRGNLVIGNGVYTEGIKRVHDQFIENQLNRSQTDVSASTARMDGLKAIENVFNPELNDSLDDEMTSFFNALQDMSSFPEELTTRANVREMGLNVVRSFHRTDSALRRLKADFNDSIAAEVNTMSDQLASVARLNVQIREMEAGTKSGANELRDERDRILSSLASKMDIQYYESSGGMMVVRGPKSTHLVEDGKSARIETTLADGDPERLGIVVTDFEGNGARVISDSVKGGKIGGLVDLRDRVIPGLIDHNNEMASALVDNFNAIHRQGYGIKGYAEATGRDFFGAIRDKSTAAQDISLSQAIMESTDAISGASSPLAPSDNVVINRLVQIKDDPMMPGNSTLREYFGNVVGMVGLDSVRAEHLADADKTVFDDLKARRESISGVSLDEEASNLLKWQACFTASSKVITTVDEMLDTVLGLKR